MALTHLEEKDAYTPWTEILGPIFGEGYKRIESRWEKLGAHISHAPSFSFN